MISTNGVASFAAFIYANSSEEIAGHPYTAGFDSGTGRGTNISIRRGISIFRIDGRCYKLLDSFHIAIPRELHHFNFARRSV